MIERSKSFDRAATVVILVGIAFTLLPIALAIMTATISQEQFLKNGGFRFTIGSHFFQNMKVILTETMLPTQLWNSIIVSFLVAFIKCAFAFTATFALVFYQSRLNRIIFALTLATVMLPVDLIVVTTYQIVANVAAPLNWLLDLTGLGYLVETFTDTRPRFELSLLDTYFGVAAPIATASTSVFIYRQFFLTLPKNLVRAAVMDGAGPIRFMIDILAPLSRTPLIATFMFWFIGGWTSYLWPVIAASRPEAQPAVVGLARLATGESDRIPETPVLMAGVLFVSFIPVVLIAVMQRRIVRGLSLSEK